MAIRLDPNADVAVIAALRREFPDAEDGVITYDMYKHCRDNIRAYADVQAKKNEITQDLIDAATKDPNAIAGGFGRPSRSAAGRVAAGTASRSCPACGWLRDRRPRTTSRAACACAP